MTLEGNTIVELRKHENLEKAQEAAAKEAANTGAITIPVVIFRQGKRILATGAIPMAWIPTRLESRSAKSARKGGSMTDVQSAMNRPEIPEHSEAIAKYLIENCKKSYIVPPLSLNVQHAVNIHVPDYPNAFLPGYLVIPGTARLAITDGQHRKSAIVKALERMSEEDAAVFGSDAVAVMITCETDINQIHQDFADCSKTKPLPPSLLAVYDRRNPANRLVNDLERHCPLFKGRIDPTSRTLSKQSTYLFLANQIRQLVKELLAGSYALSDVELEKRAAEVLSDDRVYSQHLRTFAEYINFLTGYVLASGTNSDNPDDWKWVRDDSIPAIQIWKQIASLPVDTLEKSQVAQKRQEGWICLTATGLNIIGRVGYHIFSNGKLKTRWREYARQLAALDWSREAVIWRNTIVQSGKILTAQTAVRNAFRAVKEAIHLPDDLD